MNFEKFVPMLSTCLLLKSYGFPQDDSLFVWVEDVDSKKIYIVERERTSDITDLSGEVNVLCAAPTEVEILKNIENIVHYASGSLQLVYNNNEWTVSIPDTGIKSKEDTLSVLLLKTFFAICDYYSPLLVSTLEDLLKMGKNREIIKD